MFEKGPVGPPGPAPRAGVVAHVSLLCFLYGLSPGDVSTFTFLYQDTTQI